MLADEQKLIFISLSTHIQPTGFNSAFAVIFIASFSIGCHSWLDIIKCQHSSKPSTLAAILMRPIQTSTITLFALPFLCVAQNRTFSSIGRLLTGIYLEDRKLEIPWNTKFDSIKNYENPKITKYDRNTFFVRWDSVTVFNGVRASMFYAANKTIFSKGKYQNLRDISFFVDTAYIKQLKDTFDHYFSIFTRLYKNKSLTWYTWRNKTFSITLINYNNKYARLVVQKPK